MSIATIMNALWASLSLLKDPSVEMVLAAFHNASRSLLSGVAPGECRRYRPKVQRTMVAAKSPTVRQTERNH